MGKQYLIGIDAGTTGTKALLFTQDGQLIAQAYRDYPISTPQTGQVEQNALDWWEAVIATVRQVCAQKDANGQVVAISLSTQGGTVVPVDETGTPLRPAIVWNDARCTAQNQAYLACASAQSLYEKTGWAMLPGLPAMQIRWIRENQPDIFQKTAMFLTTADYLSLKMTGIAAIDPSNAGINQLTDIRTMTYDAALLRFAGISEDQLPAIIPSGQVIGSLTQEAADALALTTETVLVAGAHDQYAVALGAGAYDKGHMLIGSGTCWVVTAIDDKPDFSGGLSQSVAAVEGLWGSLWSLSTGGICLDWLRKNITLGADPTALDYDTLNRQIAQCQAAQEGLFFYPFTGIGDQGKRFSRATFTGLDLHHDRFSMARAVMEGVVFQIVWMLRAFPTESSPDGIKLTGGASRSRVWCQILADISGLPVRIPQVADLACVGAAILAGMGSGLYQSAAEGYQRLSVSEQVIYPQPEAAAQYARLMTQYQRQAKAIYESYQ